MIDETFNIKSTLTPHLNPNIKWNQLEIRLFGDESLKGRIKDIYVSSKDPQKHRREPLGLYCYVLKEDKLYVQCKHCGEVAAEGPAKRVRDLVK